MSKRSISNITLHNASTATGFGIEYDVSTASNACVEIISEGTFTAIFEGKSLSDRWDELSGINKKTLDMNFQATANGLYDVPLSGITKFRVHISVIGESPVTVLAKMED